MRATQMTGQMARFYKLPLRSSGVCAANVPDGQAMWETANSLWAAVQSGTNMVYHAAGWLEGGLIASYEKFVIDCETLQQIIHYMKPIGTSEEDIAIDAIAEVGPRSHFFGAAHTQARYETAFYSPFLSDWRNYEAWEAAGSVQTPQRANAIWKQILAEFEPPALDPAIEENLRHCPETARILQSLPLAGIDGLCPNVFFSSLQPRTHIPPHHGESNARLIAHLPLLVPDGCRFRVGFEEREWEVGQTLIFDDTLLHEAVNNSDELRVVLIFDLWNPLLTDEERILTSKLAAATREFGHQESL
jgi:hypothetical protein